jgi:hypothetical protein
MSPDKLSIGQLQSRLRKFAPRLKQLREEMSPLLAELRKRMNAQGQKGKGFGAWVDQNLPITRRTADLWADEFEGKRTSRNISKDVLVPTRRLSPDDPYPLSLAFSPERRQEFEEAALALDPEELEQVIFDAVTEAAHRKRKGKARKATAGR